MDTFTAVLGELVSNAIELAGIAFETIADKTLKFVEFCLWALAGVIVVPGIFIASTIYPMWEKWGDTIRK